jgi:hypothetical protein
MMSDMTAKYIEARLREGPNFDYLKWFRSVQVEKAQAKIVAAPVSSGEPLTSEIGNPTNTSNRQDKRQTSVPAIMKKAVPNPRTLRQSDHEPRNESSRRRIKRRLEKVCDAWNDFQASRARDAVYSYLGAVFALADRYKGWRRTRKLLRHAFSFAGLSFDETADPFTGLIRCTCDSAIDYKAISKYARALRYATHCQVPTKRAKKFMKETGGVNECAQRYARDNRRNSR